MRTKRCRRDCPHRHPACQDHCEILKRQNEERKEKEKWLKEQFKMSGLDIYHLKTPSYVMIVTEKGGKVNGK